MYIFSIFSPSLLPQSKYYLFKHRNRTVSPKGLAEESRNEKVKIKFIIKSVYTPDDVDDNDVDV